MEVDVFQVPKATLGVNGRVYARASIAERFWRFVNKNGQIPDNNQELGRCWIWTGSQSVHDFGNYGTLWINGKSREYCHRISYIIHNGKIPSGLQLDHLCRNTLCCNPKHLEAVSCRENVLRGIGPAAVRAKATHCVHGHEFSENNTKISKSGHRICISCSIIAQNSRVFTPEQSEKKRQREKDRYWAKKNINNDGI